MPLAMAQVGDVNIIKRISGRDEVRQHLAEPVSYTHLTLPTNSRV